MSTMAEERSAALGQCDTRMRLPSRYVRSEWAPHPFPLLRPGNNNPFGARPPEVIQNDIDSITAELLL